MKELGPRPVLEIDEKRLPRVTRLFRNNKFFYPFTGITTAIVLYYQWKRAIQEPGLYKDIDNWMDGKLSEVTEDDMETALQNVKFKTKVQNLKTDEIQK
ncbi:hypothetical protein AKO1_009233 [Acrasis kona]|uniref:Uncharacterized protein n=1 Tax=Acrasis kona TaxID=1008807 RepID=A0AAW2ZHK1_9EUKA